MSGFLIQRNDGGQPVYFCPKIGKKFGSPMGGWTPDKHEALSFERELDATHYTDVFGVALGATIVMSKDKIHG